METININFSKITGKVKPMNAVNNGPSGSKVRATKGNSPYYEALQIPYARTHDSAFYSAYGNSSGQYIVDIHRIFPDFSKDENDPDSYLFTPTDIYLSDINAVGTKVFYRLGASIEHGYKMGTYPPKDFKKWAVICEKIIRHYTEGLWNGFNFDIEYWEIWNEPDCRNADGSNPCWQGTVEQFYDLFEITAKHLKSCFPHLKIGGPAFTGVYDEACIPFFKFIKERQVPLDFFSYHHYSRNPKKLKRDIERCDDYLKQFGLEHIETSLNEWNYIRAWLGDEYDKSMRYINDYHGSAFVSSMMAVGQKSSLSMLMYYEGRPGLWCGLFDEFGKPQKPYYAFACFRDIRALGNAVDSEDTDFVYSLASTNGTDSAVMLSHFEDNDEDNLYRDIKLSIKDIPNENGIKAQFYLVDKDNDMVLLREEYISVKDFSLFIKMRNYSTLLIKFSPIE